MGVAAAVGVLCGGVLVAGPPLTAASALPASPQVVKQFTVNSVTDAVDSHPGDGVCRTAAGECTLRAAVQEANATSGPVEIDLDAVQQVYGYVLALSGPGEDAAATGDLDINNDVVIEGNGARILAWSGLGSPDRIFDIGTKAGSDPQVTLDDVNLDGGYADQGGAIRLTRGSLTMKRSSVGDAFATDEGGGIFQAATAGPLVLDRTNMEYNEAMNGGGALSTAGKATVNASKLYSSTVTGTAGSAIHQLGGSLTLALDAVTDGKAQGAGGSTIATASGSTLTIRNSTVADNTGTGPVLASAGTTSIRQSTFRDAASGAAIDPGGGTVSIGGSIVSGNPACAGSISSIGYDLLSDSTCGVAAVGDRPGVLPQLTPLADHGGPTPTLAPLSPEGIDAIPVGTAELCAGSALVDQRLQPRPLGPACDIGAVEMDIGIHHFTVDSAGDAHDADIGDDVCDVGDGTCTLRAAIDEANANPGQDVITIAPGVDPALSGTQGLTLSDPVIIHGGGATITTTDDTLPAFSVTSLGGTTALDHLTIKAGPSTTLDYLGVYGGGIYMGGRGRLLVSDTTITGVHAGYGAGIYQASGTLDLRRSTIDDNESDGDLLPVLNDTYGGGLYLYNGTAVITDSTFAGNNAPASFKSYGFGAEIYKWGGSLMLIHTDVSGDGFPFPLGTSITPAFEAEAGKVIVEGSVIAGTCALGRPGNITYVQQYDVETGTSCQFAGTGDRQSWVDDLGALADNGGSTQTLLPPSGSALVDAIPIGTPGLCDASTPTDQRDLPRPSGAGCDIGSVERQPSDP
jgi:CSLREA domain-containing protein